MIEICSKDLCTGCGACLNICPHTAIGLLENAIGYIYPAIDAGKCVDCGLCAKICPVNHPVEKKSPLHAYAVYSKNAKDRDTSASGGASSVITSDILLDGGIVYGSVQNSCMDIKCERISELKDASKIKGSKYVQSPLGDNLRKAKKDLRDGKKVVFTGTPCQIAGLKAYLGKEYENLYTIDLVCHGVPSARLLKDNVSLILAKRKNIVDISTLKVAFRSKNRKKKKMDFFFTLKNSRKVYYKKMFPDDYYISGFMSGLFFRQNCFSCPYAESNRTSDITIADFWGCKSALPEMDENLGVSLMLTNTEKGVKLFDKIKNRLVYEERSVKEAVCGNGQLMNAFPEPLNYGEFQRSYQALGYRESCRRFVLPYIKEQKKRRLIMNIKYFILSIPYASRIIKYIKKIRRI